MLSPTTTIAGDNSIKTLDSEAKAAFEYLNKIRAKPSAFSKQIKANLNYVEPRPSLNWNDILAQVARNKALDMANRNYFSHINPEGEGINILISRAGYPLKKEWFADKAMNTFESIASGYETGIEVIKGLILDKRVPSLGHRNHLLGIGEWYGSFDEIGIGFVVNPNSLQGTYICIIIARKGYD